MDGKIILNSIFRNRPHYPQSLRKITLQFLSKNQLFLIVFFIVIACCCWCWCLLHLCTITNTMMVKYLWVEVANKMWTNEKICNIIALKLIEKCNILFLFTTTRNVFNKILILFHNFELPKTRRLVLPAVDLYVNQVHIKWNYLLWS